jgi:LmbE family N-acetylglucosaminyl deacetylase
MIVSQVDEAEWIEALQSVQEWTPPDQPILLVSPHPDDETLGAGGFLAAQRLRGIDVTVVAVTDGENAYPDTPDAALKLGNLRRHEQERALARLGVPAEKIIRFGLPDSGLRSREQELAERLMPFIASQTHVLAPWPGDFHPDHEVCGRAAQAVALQAGATLTFYFFWTWHRGTPALLNHLVLRAFPLSAGQLQAKTEALREHYSQLVHHSGQPILPESLLAPARRPFEVFAIA